MIAVFKSSGREVPLGKKLGIGGEGAVYDVPALGNDIVAKVYHEPISHEKQNKLRNMAQGCDELLKKVSAWPVDTLHKKAGGPICGFFMPKVAGYEPMHHLYGPSHRKQRFPHADWAFLVYAARNTAAAFEVIHTRGHVIGDVNPNLVFVAKNSFVKLIDCDSFQVTANGKRYLCEVGVPHFTPPELQRSASFKGIQRTRNHDNFGLALLLFHLLLMGRHPFSGVYAGSSDMPLERAIEQFRYAFGLSAAQVGMKPPPNSVTPNILPSPMAALFERAFSSEGGQPHGRPLAREWIVAIDQLKAQLRTCGKESIHKYYSALSKCPWCAAEQSAGIYFFIAVAAALRYQEGAFSIGQAWARITAIESPGPAPQINSSGFNITPKPIPEELRTAKGFSVFKKIAAVALILGCLVVWPSGIILALIVGYIMFFSGVDDSKERQERRQALNVAQKNIEIINERWKREAGEGRFQAKFKELAWLKVDYENLGKQYSTEQQKLRDSLRQSQLHKFLDGYFLEDHNIPGIGSGRKSTLVSFGIESAADISWNKVRGLKGFGRKLTKELVDWRKGIESKFVFDPTKGVDPADIAALNQRFARKRRELETALTAGSEQLKLVRGQILQERSQIQRVVLNAMQEVAQAQADLSELD